MGATPNYGNLLGVIWGDYYDSNSPIFAAIGAATNIAIGSNPPYAASDFYAIYPQFNTVAFPTAVVNAYIALASSCLQKARYCEMWPISMSLFIAHYLTLWAQSAQSPNSNLGQIAASGIAIGIKTSKSAGDVSVGITPIDDLGGWGAFRLTIFGQQFATMAKTVGSGGMLIY
jgi:hypothetical protein